MGVCVCGHVHTDGCPCGCTILRRLGHEGGPVSACYMSYTGIYKKHYTLDETA